MPTETTGTIFDIKRYAIHDGPGIRTTVFFKGCPLRCWWCHNPESQSPRPELVLHANNCIHCMSCLPVCPQGAIQRNGDALYTERASCTGCGNCAEACYSQARQISGRRISAAQVMAEIERDIPFYDQSGGGATFSGGEPLMQPDFLSSLLRLCKQQGIHTAVDTSGYASWEILEHIRPFVDLFLYDLKLVDEQRHKKYTGVSNRPILRNLKALSETGCRLIVRIPLVPGVNDDSENMRLTGAVLAALPHLESVEILAYHKIGVDKYASLGVDSPMPDTRSPTNKQLLAASAALQSFDLPLHARYHAHAIRDTQYVIRDT